MTKNNVKANIWKLYMIFEANKEFMENLSLQRTTFSLHTGNMLIVDYHVKKYMYIYSLGQLERL